MRPITRLQKASGAITKAGSLGDDVVRPVSKYCEGTKRNHEFELGRVNFICARCGAIKIRKAAK